MLLTALIFPAYADVSTPTDFGIKVIPGKIVENSEGIIEVYSITGDTPVDKLIVTSSDPSKVQILDVKQDESHMVSNVKIKTFASSLNLEHATFQNHRAAAS